MKSGYSGFPATSTLKDGPRNAKKLAILVGVTCAWSVEQCRGAIDIYADSGGATSGQWIQTANWQNGAVPKLGDSAQIFAVTPNPPFAEGLNGTISAATVSVNASSFGSLGANWFSNGSSSSSGQTLTLNGSSSFPLFTLGAANTGQFYLGGETSDDGLLTVDLPGLGGLNTFAVNSSTGILICDCTITGAGGITQTGPGKIELEEGISSIAYQNTFSGGYTLDSGTLQFNVSSNSSSGGTLLGGPVGTGPLTVNGGYITAPVAVSIANTVNVSGGTLNYNTSTITFTGGIAFMSAPSLAVTATSPATITANMQPGILVKDYQSITISGGTLNVSSASSTSSRTVVETSALTFAGTTGAWSGVMDIGANDLIVHGGSVANLTNQLKSGYNLGYWNGTSGIRSSAAASDTAYYHSIGVMLNNSGSGKVTATFDGQAVAITDVLARYTYAGDANLDGDVNQSDYTLIDSNYNSGGHLTGWYNGDFNYDGKVDGSDYSIIDSSYSHLHPNGTASLVFIESLSHWKIPGYAAYYLPIWESQFGMLTSAEYSASLDAGTPEEGPAASAFAIAVAVPEPAAGIFGVALVTAALSARRHRQTVSG